jgi:ketosteroid isomerase-like protein
MTESSAVMEELARQVGIALGASDLRAFTELLDPHVTWGAPGARTPTCQNRNQVLAWYQRGRESGTRVQVSDVAVMGDRLLVSLTLRGTDAAQERGGAALKWQVLTVRGGRIIDIVGFDDRTEAIAHADASVA